MINIPTLRLSATKMADFHACPELWRRRHLLGEPDPEINWPARAGSAFHAGLRAWYDGVSLDDARAALRAAWLGDVDPEVAVFGIGNRQYLLSHFEDLLIGYTEKWPRDSHEVLRNESLLMGEIGGVPYEGHVDRLVRFDDGSVYVQDTKTRSWRFEETWFASFALSWQFAGYVELTGAEGAFVDAVYVDTRDHKVDAAHYARRGPYRYPPWRLAQLSLAVRTTWRHIQELLVDPGPQAVWPMQTASCLRFGRLCPMWNECMNVQESA